MAMSLAYMTSEDSRPHSHGYSIDATHPYKLPGVRCPNCGVWSTVGVSFPTVDAKLLFLEADLPQEPSPITLERFKKAAEKIKLCVNLPLCDSPGAEFGPLHGKAKGTVNDFAWLNPWTPLARRSTFLMIREAGVELQGTRAQLVFEKPSQEPLMEIEALAKVRLDPELVPARCELCLRLPLKVPERLILDGASFDPSIPFQRIVELPTILIANESFKQFVGATGLRGISFNSVELSR